jgi:hypothetical protein
MDYFFLKIGKGNSQAKEWLEGRNPLKRPAAVIYFDKLTEGEYKRGKGKRQPRDFWERGLTEKSREATRMVVVHGGEVWILKPAGKVKFLRKIRRPDGTECTPKAMPVNLLARRAMKDVPPVLACIGVNQHYARRTFTQINHWGNFKAIDWAARAPFKGEHWDLAQQGPIQFLECLGSVEFETLIAKLFEANGCFVPAYRGGVIKDIDLFVHNDSRTDLDLSGLRIRASRSASIQVKTWSNGMQKPDAVDYLIGFDVKGKRAFDAEWVLNQVRSSPAVAAWLKRSLNWLPKEFFQKFRLN